VLRTIVEIAAELGGVRLPGRFGEAFRRMATTTYLGRAGTAKRPQMGEADSRESPRVRESPASVSLRAVPSLSFGRPRLATPQSYFRRMAAYPEAMNSRLDAKSRRAAWWSTRQPA
jgi:hypothetical protein